MLIASIVVAAGKWLALLAALAVALFGAVVQLPLLTTSSAKTFRACPRLYQLRYVLGYRPAVESETLRFGSLIHAALEMWWLAAWWGQRRGRLVAALDAIEREAARFEVDDFDRARAEVMMHAYHARWVDEPMRVVAVEATFTGPLVNPETGAASRTWARGGKIDAIAEMPERGGLVVVEHKTSSEDITEGSDYWTRLRLDPQISNYLRGAEDLGLAPVAVLYDVLAKPSQRPLKATPVEARKYTKPTKTEPSRLYAGQRESDETVEEYRARIEEAVSREVDAYVSRGVVVRLEQDVADAATDTWQIGQQLREARRTGCWPRNPDACKRYGRTCEFLQVCTRTASLDDPTRFRRAERAHEELGMGQRTSNGTSNGEEIASW